MNQKEKMISDLMMDIDGYYMQLVYLKDLMEVEGDISKNEEQMKKARNFKLIIECALIDSYMLVFMKLYDKSEKAKTIPNLIFRCIKNINLFKEEDKVFQKLIEFQTRMNTDEYLSHVISTLIDRRDTVYAHNDSKYFGEKCKNDETYLKMYHLWFLRDFTEEVLNYISLHLTPEYEGRKTKYDFDLKKIYL